MKILLWRIFIFQNYLIRVKSNLESIRFNFRCYIQFHFEVHLLQHVVSGCYAIEEWKHAQRSPLFERDNVIVYLWSLKKPSQVSQASDTTMTQLVNVIPGRTQRWLKVYTTSIKLGRRRMNVLCVLRKHGKTKIGVWS